MEFHELKPNELAQPTKGRNPHQIEKELEKFISSNMKIARVTDDYYNNNNDLRRGIQSVIENKHLNIHVFMKYGNTYIEKEL